MRGVRGTRARSRRAPVAGPLVLALLVAGCSGQGAEPSSAPVGPTAAPAPSTSVRPSSRSTGRGATATPGVTATPDRSATPGPRTPPPLVRPSTSAGPLRPSSLPAVAALLGAGWRPFVDPGSSEAGYLGNGTPWLARDPGEVAATVLPLGCRHRSVLPTPRYALETDGTGGGGHRAVVIRARFATAAQAGAFVERTAADARACARQPAETGPAGVSAPVSQVRAVDAVVVSDRVDVYAEPGTGRWSEFKVARGTDVLLLAVDQRLDGPHGWREPAVAAALRAALGATS